MATSPYAASVEDTEDDDDKEMKSKPKLAANGRYIVMHESEIRSEEGGDTLKKARFVLPSTESTRTLYDRPRDPSILYRIETYRQAHPAERPSHVPEVNDLHIPRCDWKI